MGATSRRTPRVRALALVLAAAALAAGASVPARVADETRTGWLNVVWQTRGVRNELVAARLFLVDEAGRGTEVAATAAALAPYGGVTGVNGRRMTVTGDLLPGGGGGAPRRCCACARSRRCRGRAMP
jgi:hypothetical protein